LLVDAQFYDFRPRSSVYEGSFLYRNPMSDKESRRTFVIVSPLGCRESLAKGG
jgi:hypothetical protein